MLLTTNTPFYLEPWQHLTLCNLYVMKNILNALQDLPGIFQTQIDSVDDGSSLKPPIVICA